MATAAPRNEPARTLTRPSGMRTLFWVVLLILFCLMFHESYLHWYDNVSRKTSYYSHAALVPFVSLFFVWRKRAELARLPRQSSNWGYAALALACVMVLMGDLLGFRIFGQAAILPLLTGLILIFLGGAALRRLWFPLAFLLFMIPLPESLTTSITFRVKMLAAEGAVQLAKAVYLPMIRDGSYINFGNDRLLIGDVCGGLRSLISLLALGAIMSHISEASKASRVLIFLFSAPIAVMSNLLRIFFLCVVAYVWGSQMATGWVHDVSGVMIYVVALALLIGLDRLLHRIAPARPRSEPKAPEAAS